jgi:dienelactone hydrolase
MKPTCLFWALSIVVLAVTGRGQPLGEPDRGQPGDLMIQRYLEAEAAKLDAGFTNGVATAEDWEQARGAYYREFLEMLGLWPLPEKSPLQAKVTGTLDRGDYQVELVHYQSRPGLYVTGNLYRPAPAAAGKRFPAIFYVCGHSGRGRDGNKTAFQSHGIWLARHGYVCLIVDTLQLGEIAGVHHGTYREGRWWWLSRGYTPAGVECWNGVRGIDYLISRPDVDPDRIGVTGISGGGAATYWIAAADERVKVAVPVSGMADLESYVSNRVVNGHCDCMFLYNAYQWPWTRLAALIAPRPLLFVNSDQDSIFPMDANERVINRLERFYSLFGAGDLVDGFVSIGGHAYRKDIRQASFRFLNTYLQNDPRPVQDSEVDLVTGPREEVHPIPPEQLRVFPKEADIPAAARNGQIDQEFVPMAQVALPGENAFAPWKDALLARLRRLTFHHFPARIPPARVLDSAQTNYVRLETEKGIQVRLNALRPAVSSTQRIILFVTSATASAPPPPWLDQVLGPTDAVYVCEPRGVGLSRWTRRHPPNYVERAHYLLGRTVDSGRVWDIAAAARYLHGLRTDRTTVWVAGEQGNAVLAIYAAVLEPEVDGLILFEPPETHMDSAAPALLNVLRVCDIPEALGMVAPRPVTLASREYRPLERVKQIYRAAGAADHLMVGSGK